MSPDTQPASDVEALLASYEEPARGAVRALREILLGAHPQVTEAVKWNSASFAVGEHFATCNVRPGRPVVLVLHRGTKVRPEIPERLPVPDPAQLLDWRTNDRANVTLRDAAGVETHRQALTDIVRSWIVHL